MKRRDIEGASLIVIAFLLAAGLNLATPSPAAAQSEGGSIGGKIQSSERAPRAKRVAKPKPEPEAEPAPRVKRAAPAPRAPRSAGGNGGNYDGAWAISAGGSCAAAGSNQITISGARVIGQGIAGSVSPSGAVSTQGSLSGLTIYGSGQISGSRASGTYRQSDGCSGPWTGYKL